MEQEKTHSKSAIELHNELLKKRIEVLENLVQSHREMGELEAQARERQESVIAGLESENRELRIRNKQLSKTLEKLKKKGRTGNKVRQADKGKDLQDVMDKVQNRLGELILANKNHFKKPTENDSVSAKDAMGMEFEEWVNALPDKLLPTAARMIVTVEAFNSVKQQRVETTINK